MVQPSAGDVAHRMWDTRPAWKELLVMLGLSALGSLLLDMPLWVSGLVLVLGVAVISGTTAWLDLHNEAVEAGDDDGDR